MNLVGSLLAVFLLAVLGGGCGTTHFLYREPTYLQKSERWSVLRSLSLDRAVEDRILALDPERVSDQDVRTVLSQGPTPRILNVHGGLGPVRHLMASFSEFLIGMGYPEAKIRHPENGTFSHSPYENSKKLAGMIAWYYEKEGMRVILVGHSQGGIQVIKVLDELAGAFDDTIPVWNPLTDEAEDRSSILDPLSGEERPVVGLQVAYATVVAAGGIGILAPNQWSMVGRLDTIPDTVEEFTGFSIGLDLWAWNFLGFGITYRANGKAGVRNVRLPASYIHVTVPMTAHLAKDEKIRDWINAYVPTDEPELTAAFDSSSENILWAADVWRSIKKHWCLEAQRLIRTKRMVLGEH